MRACAVLVALAACSSGGSNSNGGSGSGTTEERPPPAHTVAVGGNHACAVTADGAVACWGDPQRGELGHSGEAGGGPARIALPAAATAVAAGERHGCALLADGRVACWGASYRKQVGGEPTGDSPAPRIVPGVSGATDVAAAGDYTCALRRDGHVSCWGGDDDGQLGRAAGSAGCIRYEFSSEPGGTCDGVPADVPGLTDAIAITTSVAYACAIRADHSVACWGGVGMTQLAGPVASRPEHGQLGPVGLRPIAGIRDAIAISAGVFAACVVRRDGTVACWGLLDPRAAVKPATTPVTIAGLHDITAIAVWTHACAVDRQGAVACWGDNAEHQLGRDAAAPATDTPAVIAALEAGGGIAVGRDITCARDRAGKVACVGSNFHGVLGTYGRELPVVPVLGVTGATAIAAGSQHACAIVGGGAVRCWGKNDHGQVGAPRDGSMHELVMSAVAVPGVTGALALALGDDASCARTASGVACWGGDVEHARGVWRATVLDGATAIAASERWLCGIVAGRVRCASLETGQPAHLAAAVTRARDLRGIAVHAVMDIDRICVIDGKQRTACWGHRLDQSGYFGTEPRYFHGLERMRGLDRADRLVMGELALCAHTARGIACDGGHAIDGALDITLTGPRCVVAGDRTVHCEDDEPGSEGASERLEVNKLGPTVELALGYEFACARDPAGSVRCTGSDVLAGDGRVMDRSSVPVAIPIPAAPR